MSCPVCGAPDVRGRCARCGTDLQALAGVGGEARLDVTALGSGDRTRKLRDDGPTF